MPVCVVSVTVPASLTTTMQVPICVVLHVMVFPALPGIIHQVILAIFLLQDGRVKSQVGHTPKPARSGHVWFRSASVSGSRYSTPGNRHSGFGLTYSLFRLGNVDTDSLPHHVNVDTSREPVMCGSPYPDFARPCRIKYFYILNQDCTIRFQIQCPRRERFYLSYVSRSWLTTTL